MSVLSAQTISQFGVNLDLTDDSDVIFRIFNNATGTAFYTSAAKSFVDDGQTYKYTDPFSFTFNPGITYGAIASSSNGATYRYDQVANTVGGFNFMTSNRNLNGTYAAPVYGAGGGVDLDTAFVLAVPEPAAWGLMILGFGLVGGVARRGRRTRVALAI